jgi:hypothetical protein
MDWKTKLDKTIDINALLIQYEGMVKNRDKVIRELEQKLTTLHAATYTAHSKLIEWSNSEEKAILTEEIKLLVNNLQDIIIEGLEPKKEIITNAN